MLHLTPSTTLYCSNVFILTSVSQELPLTCLNEYLSGPSQRVCVNGGLSKKFYLTCGIPQGSGLGALIFIIYASDLFHIIDKYGSQSHAYADDTQLYLSFKAGNTLCESEAVDLMQRCIRDIQDWMAKNELKMNDGKTKFVISGTRQQHPYHNHKVCQESLSVDGPQIVF